MNGISMEHITLKWTERILGESSRLTLEKLSAADMPQELKRELSNQGEKILRDEIERIYDSPFLSAEKRGNGSEKSRNHMRELLMKSIEIPAESIQAIVENTLKDVIERWQTEPIGLRAAAEDPQGLAAVIFRRAASILPGEENAKPLSCSVASSVCEFSGLEPLGQAVALEGEISQRALDAPGLSLLIRRFLLLKDRYQVGRPMTVFEGTGRTLEAGVAPSSSETAETAEADAVPAEAAVSQKSIPLEAVEKPSEAGAELFTLLMEREKQAFFSKKLFSNRINLYRGVVGRICRQKSLKNALVIADNELFLLDIPRSADTATAREFLNLIRRHFKPGRTVKTEQ